jgi:hypothetical protein
MNKKKSIISLIIIFIACSVISCSNDDDPLVSQISHINVVVKTSSDSTVVPGANVILYDASNGNPLRRGSSGNDGTAIFENLNPGTFFVKISAQNFNNLPPENIASVPFTTTAGQRLNIIYYLTAHPGQSGRISGFVSPVLPGVLVKAVNTNNTFSTYTGPDGYYVLFNVDYGTYNLSASMNGYRSAADQEVTISSSNNSAAKDILLTSVAGGSLSGTVTFLATQNGIVDISLLDNQTGSAIKGLATKIDSGRAYNLTGIPKGEYIAWPSFQNDGYVMDPDWMFKNPGGLNVSFLSDSGSKTLNFSVTGAINIISPTNPAASIIPVEADSTIPLFTWNAYSSAKEYIIEVRDLNGNLIWGGFTPDGTIRHSQIQKEKNSIRFNFDGSATAQLVKGEIYQWKIYADNDAAANIQKLISSSEDLMGIFKAK